MAILFAIGIGVGMSEKNDGTGGIAALASWLMITTLLSTGVVTTLIPSIADNATKTLAFNKIANPFIGILSGVIGSSCYNKFKNTKLPNWLAFFSGKRCVAIIAGLVSIIRPWQKLGTDVTEFKVAGAKAYWAPVLDFCTKEIVASDISTSPDLAQQHRMLDRLLEALPDGAAPTMHSDMGWQYQHESYASRLEGAGITQSMSRKGNCIDNAATEQLFGHVKDEFYRGREWGSFGDFKRDLEEYIAHWNTRRRQVRLKGLTPEEFRNRALAA